MALLIPAASQAKSPIISSLSPTSGTVGTSITINGSNFGSTQGSSSVQFNGQTATPTSWSASKIVAPVPAGATTGNVVVTVAGVASNGVSFTVIPPPSISSLSPTSGAVGTSVTINGSNFGSTQGSSTVTFNGQTATPTSWSATSIVAPVPAGATTGNVVITVSGQTSNGVSFTVTPSQPTISSLTDTSNNVLTSVVVGSQIKISGSNFGATGTVTFNGTAATQISYWSNNVVITYVPAGATTGNVVVTVGGQASNGVSLIVSPNITGVSPSSGFVGTIVTIMGTTFGSTQGASSVTFNNGIAATPQSWSDTSIVVPVPAGATSGFLGVTINGQNSCYCGGSYFTLTPSISNLSPTSGPVNTVVTINGSNFGISSGQGGYPNALTFNGTAATPTSWSPTSIVAAVPAGATTGNVVVTVGGSHSSNGVNFGVVQPPPSLSSLSPSSGTVDAAVTITGGNFGASQGSGAVTFNGTTAFVSNWSATSIAVYVPAGATTGNVVVTANGQASNGVTFTVISPPNISSLSPTVGVVGNSVTVTGTNFGASQGSSTLTFNGVAATPTSWSATSIVAPIPAGATTGSVLVETCILGSSCQLSNQVPFTVVPVAITGISPASGPMGSTVTITGSGFGATQNFSSLTFNGLSVGAQSWSDNTIVAQVPPGNTTGNVIVTPNGQQPSNGVSFTGLGPSISSISPTSGAVGAAVTITGTHFSSASQCPSASCSMSVTFNGRVAQVSTWTDTSLVVSVPVGNTTGNVQVTLSNNTGTSVQASNAVPFIGLPPVITSISPTSGEIGDSITISGSHFGPTGCNGGGPGCALVKFNGLIATPLSWSDSSIAVSVPAGHATGNVVVTISDGTIYAAGTQTSNSVPFTSIPPTITSVSPASGTMGTAVTINGSRFGAVPCNSNTCNTWVAFNGLQATPQSWSDTRIVAYVPPGNATGNVTVVQFDPSGDPLHPALNYQFSNGVSFTGIPPTIANISPGSAPVGTSITINGANLSAQCGNGNGCSAFVTFNGLQAVTTSWSDTSIVAQVPVGVTTGNVVVTISGGAGPNSNQSSNGVVFFAQAPTISSLSAASGLANTPITITGSYFGATQGGSTITFNGVIATPTSWSDTSITVPVPAGASTGNVVVNTSSQASNGVFFTVLPPVIASVFPSSGGVGVPVTITGSSFGPNQGSSTLTFNGTSAQITAWSQNSISTTVPAGATPGNLVITESGQASNPVNFNVLAPNIASLSPTSGSAGTLVTIAGSNFGPTQGGGTLTFNGTAVSPLSWSATSITALAPAGVTTGNVLVTVGAQTSNPVLFTVGLPTLASVSPTSGGSGTAVTITGANFGATQGGSTVSFNGMPATPTTWTADSISTLVPSGAASGNIVVAVGGQASNGINFTVTSNPGISGISPPLGAAGTSVVITGSNFGNAQGSNSVTFNNTVATPTSWSANTIAAPVPAGATTGSVIVTVNGQPSNGVTFDITPNVINYSYDDVGRLVGVVDPAGNAAGYSYDAVGNILSISRQAPGQAVILSFTPSSGFAGSSVSISGSGFSPVAGQNTVQFDGVSATITSATPTQLVATVPNGAGTGPITVTSPAGAATSNANFTVSNGLAPIITSITPGIAVVGTMVTIAGNNFDPTPANDLTTFNITRQFQQSVTATSISAAIPPNTGSGRITLSTPTGKAVSSQDLYVPRSSYNSLCCYYPTDVGYTGRITPGGSQTVNFPLPGGAQIVMMLFDAVAGQQASIIVTPNPSSTQCGIGLYDPTNAGSSLDYPLPLTGTYTIVIVQSNTSGSCTIGLNLTPPPVTGTIQPGGPPVTVTIASPGQRANLAFYATRNQKLSVSVSSASFTTYTISCNNSCGGFSLWGTYVTPSGGQSAFFDTTTIPAPGKYNLTVQPGSTGVMTGTIKLQLNNDTDVTGTITPGGPPVTVTTTVPGQDARLTFSGTAGQRVAVSINNVTNPQASVALLNPDGSFLSNWVTVNNTGGSFFLDTSTLPTTGTYTVWVAHSGTINTGYTGSETLQISNVSDETGTISPGGPAVIATTTVLGQDVRLTFSGTTGQKVSLLISNVTNPAATVTLLNPNGTTLVSGGIKNTGGPFFLDTQTLPANGTYTVWVQHNGANIGSETLQLYNDSDVTGTITPSGSAVTETTVPGQDVKLTFSGTAGQKLSVLASNITNLSFCLQILQPDGTNLGGASCGSFSYPLISGSYNYLDAQTLTATGTYSLWVQHQGTSAGSETLQLYQFTDIAGAIAVGGPGVTETTVLGQDVRLTFSGTAGQHVTAGISNVTNPQSNAYLLNPDGTILDYYTQITTPSNTNNVSGLFVLGLQKTLPATGTYTVWIQHNDPYAGSEKIQAYNAATLAGTVSVNGSPVTVTIVPGQQANLTFSGSAGRQVTVHLTNSALGYVDVGLSSPTASLTGTHTNASSFNLQSEVLPSRGTYTISISPDWNFGGNSGPITVTVTSP